MRRLLFPALLALACAVNLGCGGDSGCSDSDAVLGNTRSGGTFVGTYDNRSSEGTTDAAQDLNLDLTITNGGVVSGTVTEPSSGRTATVVGTVNDLGRGCDQDVTRMTLDFTFDGDAPRELESTRSLVDSSLEEWDVVTVYRQGATGDETTIGRGRILLNEQNTN